MADAYDDLVNLVTAWSNRDSEVLPKSVIRSALGYAADTAYRDLEIPPLEYSVYYVISENDVTNLPANSTVINPEDDVLTLPVPNDLSTFIHVRNAGSWEYDASSGTDTDIKRTSSTGPIDIDPAEGFNAIVWNEKADIRTFHDFTAQKVSENYWTRQGNNILASASVGDGCVIEVFYYRRLPALNARYTIDSNTDTMSDIIDPNLQYADEAAFDADTDKPSYLSFSDFTQISGTYYIGNLVPNWLRDDNEKVVLFGALWHCFDYVGEEDMSQKYLAKFRDEIANVNMEEKMRKSSGGNVQVHYNSNLI